MQRNRTKRHYSEEDEDNTQGQQMLALRTHLKKPKVDDKESIQLRSKISSDRKHLKELLQQGQSKAEQEETQRQDELVSAIKDALQTPNPSTTKGDDAAAFEGTSIAVNAVYPSVERALKASEDLIDKYLRLEDMISNLRGEQQDSMVEKWKTRVNETEQLLQKGARTALRNVKKMLGAQVEAEADDGGQNGQFDEDMGKKGMEPDCQLHKSLQYMERGVKRMVKSLPQDELVD